MPIARARCGAIILLISALSPLAASAAEPSGCAAFKWPIDRERALLTAEPAPLASGAELQALPPTALALKLRAATDAALPAPPERAPAPDRYAGFVRIKQVAKAGNYTIALSAAGWVDIMQDGRTLKPTGFSGATDCAGIRKLVRYQLGTGELLLQISGMATDTVTFAVLPAD